MTTTPRNRRHRRIALAIAALTAIAVTAGCAGAGSDSESSDASRDIAASSVEAPTPASLRDGLGADLAQDGAVMDDAEAGGSLEAPGLDKRVEPGALAVISTGTVSLEARDVGKARFEVRKVVDKYRGTVTDQETTTGEEGSVSTAHLVLRVPSASFAEATADLEQVATLTGSSTSGEDVSSEVVDVEARVRAQRRSVERIEALLARASTIQEIVSIESQLSRRQADLDSLVSRQKFLADQTSLSTINVFIEQPGADQDPEPDDAGGFLGGLHDGWDSFVTGVSAVLTLVGFALPWLLLLLIVGVPLRLLLRRRTPASDMMAP